MPELPGAPVSLLVSVIGDQVAQVLANFHRADLKQPGFGNGRQGVLGVAQDYVAARSESVSADDIGRRLAFFARRMKQLLQTRADR